MARAPEFRQIHLCGEIPQTTPFHQDPPLRTAVRASTTKSRPNLPYNATYPTPQLTLQRNAPCTATHPAAHPATKLTLQRNLPYSATHPAPQRTLQRTLRPNLPYSETYPTPHPAAKLTLHRNAPCSAPCDQTYPTAPYLTNLRRYSPPLSSYYLYSYKLYYAFCTIVHFISSVNF